MVISDNGASSELAALDAHSWELYHVAEDIPENHNLAAENRERLIGMIAAWYVEAGKYKVLPIDGSGTQRFGLERPQIAQDRTSYVYYPVDVSGDLRSLRAHRGLIVAGTRLGLDPRRLPLLFVRCRKLVGVPLAPGIPESPHEGLNDTRRGAGE
jgi:hypothetical protein